MGFWPAVVISSTPHHAPSRNYIFPLDIILNLRHIYTQSQRAFLDCAGARAPGDTMKPIINYLQAARVELSKVVWPNRRQTIRLTLVVIGFSLAMAAVLGALDYVFSELIKKLIIK